MLITEPRWINHGYDKRRKPAIFSIQIDPTGTRVATGGEDYSIRLWKLKSCISSEDNLESIQDRLLSTLRSHTGAVLCTRWSNGNGKLLASASDDKSIIVWNQVQNAYVGNLTGDKNQETWKPFRTLSGHRSDVCHLEWSPDNDNIASAGFDNLIYIWSTTTFEKVRKLSGHEGFVKGISWDPLGQYLASQSDDKTLKVWRTADWSCEHTFSDPFQHAPCNTYFRRLSWSADGSHIIATNAEDGNLPVACILSRKDWKCDINLHGHQAPIEVAAFNPKLFKSPKEKVKEPELICALGSQDCSISIWSTNQPRAIVCITNIFEQGILDMCWSPDGYTLIACSFDGSTKVFTFTAKDFGEALSDQDSAKFITRVNAAKNPSQLFEDANILRLGQELSRNQTSAESIVVSSPTKPKAEIDLEMETVSHNHPILNNNNKGNGNESSVHVENAANTTTPPSTIQVTQQELNLMDARMSNSQPSEILQQQKTSQTKDGRKRITPILVSSGTPTGTPTTAKTANFTSSIAGTTNISEFNVGGLVTAASSNNVFMGPKNFGNQTKYVLPTIMNFEKSDKLLVLEIPEIKPVIQHTLTESGRNLNTRIEIKNKSSSATLYCFEKEELFWEQHFYSKILFASAEANKIIVVTLDAELNIYSATGRRLLPTILLDATPSYFVAEKGKMLMITTTGFLWLWSLSPLTCELKNINIGTILKNTKAPYISSVSVANNGKPLVRLSTGKLFLYDPAFGVWLRLEDQQQQNKEKMDKKRLIPIPQKKSSVELEALLLSVIMREDLKEYLRLFPMYIKSLVEENRSSRIIEICNELSDSEHERFLGIPKTQLLDEVLSLIGDHAPLQRIVSIFHRRPSDS